MQYQNPTPSYIAAKASLGNLEPFPKVSETRKYLEQCKSDTNVHVYEEDLRQIVPIQAQEIYAYDTEQQNRLNRGHPIEA